MAAVADAVVVVVSKPPPEPALSRVCPISAAAKALGWVLLASAWVSCAALAASTVARRAWGLDSLVAFALLMTSVGAVLFGVLLLAIFSVHAMRTTGLRVSRLSIVVKEIVACVKEILNRKALGALMRELLQDTAGLRIVAWAPFFLLLIIGFLMLALSAEGTKREWIGQALFRVLGFAAISCFIIIPSLALKLWKTQAMQCRIAISETKTTSGVEC